MCPVFQSVLNKGSTVYSTTKDLTLCALLSMQIQKIDENLLDVNQWTHLSKTLHVRNHNKVVTLIDQ